METVERYLQVFEDLRRKKRWATDTNVLRFAALTLAAAEIDDPGGRLEAAADELRRRAGTFGKLNSPIRYVVAAMVLRKGLRPATVYERVTEVQVSTDATGEEASPLAEGFASQPTFRTSLRSIPQAKERTPVDFCLLKGSIRVERNTRAVYGIGLLAKQK